MPGPEVGRNPFEESLTGLSQIAMREAGAAGYAFFKVNAAGALSMESANGLAIPEQAVREPGKFPLISYPLHVNNAIDAILVFIFDGASSRRKSAELDRMAAAIETVWASARSFERYRQHAERAAELEAQLANSKIVNRTLGFLSDRSGQELVEAVANHVEGVLRPSATGPILEKIVTELESELEERKLTAEAKSFLQRFRGMSEDQAHSYLRTMSRRTRKPLRDVARGLIEDRREHA